MIPIPVTRDGRVAPRGGDGGLRGLRRFRLRRRADAGRAGRTRQRPTRQSAAGAQPPRLLQRPVPRRPRHRHGDLPRRAHRAHPPDPSWRTGPLRPAVHQLPAARRVHQSPVRAGDQHPPPRGHAATSQSPSTRPGLAAGLPHPPAGRRTQDQPLRAQTLGRTQSPMPRPSPHPHRRPRPSEARSTSPASPPSACTTDPLDGPWPPGEAQQGPAPRSSAGLTASLSRRPGLGDPAAAETRVASAGPPAGRRAHRP